MVVEKAEYTTQALIEVTGVAVVDVHGGVLLAGVLVVHLDVSLVTMVVGVVAGVKLVIGQVVEVVGVGLVVDGVVVEVIV